MSMAALAFHLRSKWRSPSLPNPTFSLANHIHFYSFSSNSNNNGDGDPVSSFFNDLKAELKKQEQQQQRAPESPRSMSPATSGPGSANPFPRLRILFQDVYQKNADARSGEAAEDKGKGPPFDEIRERQKHLRTTAVATSSTPLEPPPPKARSFREEFFGQMKKDLKNSTRKAASFDEDIEKKLSGVPSINEILAIPKAAASIEEYRAKGESKVSMKKGQKHLRTTAVATSSTPLEPPPPKAASFDEDIDKKVSAFSKRPKEKGLLGGARSGEAAGAKKKGQKHLRTKAVATSSTPLEPPPPKAASFEEPHSVIGGSESLPMAVFGNVGKEEGIEEVRSSESVQS